jgi:hypothetical protein
MKKQVLYRAAAATVLGLSLTTGIAAADTGNITHSGPGSSNKISSSMHYQTHVMNNNNLSLTNPTTLTAYTGDASTTHNTTGGGAMTGAVLNNNTVGVNADINNTKGAASTPPASSTTSLDAAIDTSGPGSSNTVTSTVSNDTAVTNNNDISVQNSTNLHGSSGNAEVSGNTTGGSATSGGVTNTTTSVFTFDVTN